MDARANNRSSAAPSNGRSAVFLADSDPDVHEPGPSIGYGGTADELRSDRALWAMCE